ncbi:WXG100 family type VII secretion target [Pedococcus dokdonensis]|jgi:WXG100 family type VII secretion target|uniref:WXG100 family type VII secretion target n=1 Tax=Pedococcus dokdonensis TaxID=443156 RepID=A0A1H0SAI0_9MICO|nr:WXG100 family type VII secretion target [Pedococcus dokdonensis]SDP38677.1 WXG100 family type VII secretion target [Pedococcus dokdonensis]
MAIAGDLEQLMTLQQVFTRNSQSVEELSSSIRSQLQNTRWEGPAADRFRSAWNTEFETALRRLGEALSDCSSEVSRRREALAQAGS